MAILTVSLAALNLQVVEGATVVVWKRKINDNNSVVPGPMTYAFTNASGIATMELAANLPSECYEVRIIILGDLKFSALIQMPATDANIQDIIISGTGEEAGAGGGIVIVSGVSNLQNTGAGAGVFSGLSGTIAQLRSLVAGNGMQIDVVGSEIVISATGSAGADGLSAYQVAVANGYVGTKVDWLASLIGAQGPAGAQGIQGVAGANGANGANGAPGETGAAGLSAYQLAVQSGFVGTQSEWLASLQGIQGPQGPAGNNGRSAYDIAVAGGYAGTEAQWLASLVGPAGAAGPAGATGAAGLSAYQVAVAGGYVGTESQWLDSLRGPQGIQGFTGNTGAAGQSAYALAVSLGFVGTEQDWILSLKGVKGNTGDTGAAGATGAAGTNGTNGTNGINGTNGSSAYQIAVTNGFIGTEAEWLTSLVGDSGLTPWDMSVETVICAYPLNETNANIIAAGFAGTPTLTVSSSMASYTMQSALAAEKIYVARGATLPSVPVNVDTKVMEWALVSGVLTGGAATYALKLRFGLIDKTTPANVVGVLEFELKGDGTKLLRLITDLGTSADVTLGAMPARVSMAFNSVAGTIAVRLDNVAQAFSASTYTATSDATPEIRISENAGAPVAFLGKAFSVLQYTAAGDITGTHAAGAKDICGHIINDAAVPAGPNSVLVVSVAGTYQGSSYAVGDILVLQGDGVTVKYVAHAVKQFANLAAFPVSGAGAALYIAADTGLLYRWDGAAYAPVGGGPVAQVDATVGGTVVIAAGTTSLDFTGAYSSTKTIDCVKIKDGATVAIHSINDIGTVTLSGTGLTFTGSLTPFFAGQVGTLTRNGNVVHAAEPESVLNKVNSIVEPISLSTGPTQYPSLLATSVHTNRRLLMQDVLFEFVASGVVLTKITGLDAALSAGVAYFGGTLYQHERIAISAIASRTYTASKDTYVDLRNTNHGTYQITYTVVNNGATAPPLDTNAYRIYKVVTDATNITSIENLANRQPTFKAPITVPDAVVAGDAANKRQLDAAAVQSITIVCSDETTALTVGAAKVTLRMPYAFTLQKVRASLTTAQTSGSIFTVDINEGVSSVLSTKLTIDNTEKTSTTAAIPAVISDTALADDAEITIDIDQIGDGTAKGLKVYLIGVKA